MRKRHKHNGRLNKVFSHLNETWPPLKSDVSTMFAAVC